MFSLFVFCKANPSIRVSFGFSIFGFHIVLMHRFFWSGGTNMLCFIVSFCFFIFIFGMCVWLLFYRLGIIVQDGASQRITFGLKGDSGSKYCLKCANQIAFMCGGSATVALSAALARKSSGERPTVTCRDGHSFCMAGLEAPLAQMPQAGGVMTRPS